MKSLDVIGIGIATMDILVRVPRSPESDETMPVSKIRICGGGPVATALVELARLGERAEYIGTIGTDMWGQMIERDFEREGVEYGRSIRIEGAESTVSVILVEDSNASRSILYHNADLPELEPHAIGREAIARARLLHLDGFHLQAALSAASIAREANTMVSFDGGAGVYLDGIEELLKKVDIMIVARQFASTVTGSADIVDSARKLKEFGARQVVITDGVQGSWFWDGSSEIHQEAYRVSPVDTTGAGDVFHGAFLHAVLQNRAPRECLRFASAAAALKCMHLGGRAGLAKQDEVERFITDYRRNH